MHIAKMSSARNADSNIESHGRCRRRRQIAVLGRRRSVISRAREGGKSNLRGRSRDQKKMEKRGKVEGPGSPEDIER